ncbi:MAG: response regulator transcription factor [Chloroflexi bacterium]|nr:response regulator transcription factor [Chloroflexota bacterium]
MTNVKTILVVDDEPTLVATLKYNLERESFRVLEAADGEAALEAARTGRPDLIVLDLMLPGLSGLEVCRILRKETRVPIIMLTAKDAEVDKVVGLETGADDYVTKPFGMPELMARVRALLRRAEPGADDAPDVVESGDLRVDLARREVQRGGSPLRLKPKELDLLGFFMRRRGRAFSREELLKQVWGYEFADDTRTVDVHVRWLRQKIEADPSQPSRLITVRGVGYRFEG